MVSSSNNPVNNKVGASISGVTNTFTVTNPSNTASSAARETITVGGGTAGDPTLNFNVSGVTNWEMGIDNSVSDNLTISQGTALGTNDVWRMDTSGRRTMPLQPCFLVYVNTQINNVTGDGTTYLVLFDTTSLDQGGNITLNSGGHTIFTAPITGNYLVQSSLNYQGTLSGRTGANVFIVKNGSAFLIGNSGIPTNGLAWNADCVLPLTAGDTIAISTRVQGGAKDIGLVGTGGGLTGCYFNGYLIC